MKFEIIKRIARIGNCECIADRDGNICIRPMLFEEVRRMPDPDEFLPEDKAGERLALILERVFNRECPGCGAGGHSYDECVLPDCF